MSFKMKSTQNELFKNSNMHENILFLAFLKMLPFKMILNNCEALEFLTKTN